MQEQSTTGTPLAILNHPWTGSLRLPRTPICPTCGEPLPPRGFYIITGVAFCGLCAAGEQYRTLTEAQIIRCKPFAGHCTNAGGVLFYTPRVGIATSLREFADAVCAEHLYAAFPMTATGEYIALSPPSTFPNPLLAATPPPQPSGYRGIRPE